MKIQQMNQKIDKNKLNNVIVSILQNTVEKPMDQEELDFNPDEDEKVGKLNPKEIINFTVKYFNIDLEPKFKINLESFPSKNKKKKLKMKLKNQNYLLIKKTIILL